MKDHLKMTLEHSDITLYNERYQMYPVMHVLSFMSPAHAMIYNTYANYNHWLGSSDNEAQMAIMKLCTPPTKFNSRVVWANYVKKPKEEKKKDNKKEEEWLMVAFDISRKTAKMYLENDEVLAEVANRVKNN